MPPSLNLFWRLMIRPLAREPVRIALTSLAVSLGVAVVLAMDLAGDAATGSFHSSLEALSGRQDFELTAVGGVPEELVGKLSLLPYDWQITPRIESFAVLAGSKRALPLVGLDLVGAGSGLSGELAAAPVSGRSQVSLQDLTRPNSVWVGESLGKRRGDTIQLLVNDRAIQSTVRGTYRDESGQSAAIMDIAAAQSALGRTGFVDRILIRVPPNSSTSLTEWQQRLGQALPEKVQLRAAGASTEENRKMLAAFRWNLRLLSYIALIVGTFLIYNTISVSVVRRRAEIGIVRALGASRSQVLAAFLLEAAFIGISGSMLGILLGRLIASSAVKLMGATVNSLYVSSRPGEISLGVWPACVALLTGVGLTLLSAWAPAREAARVAPVEAMARAR